jgi:hypothetical protein
VQDVLRGTGAEAALPGQLVREDRVAQLLDRGDAELLVQHHGLLRAEGRDAGQLAHAGRYLRAQRLHGGHAAVAEVLGDLLGDRLAHVGYLLEALEIERGHVDRVPSHRAGRPLVDPSLERVPARDRQQVGVFLEQRRD